MVKYGGWVMLERILDWVGMHFLKAVVLVIAVVVALLCLTVYNVSNAADVRVSWTNPTQNTDGTAIPATGAGSIATNRVEWGSCVGAAFGTPAGSQSIPVATSYVVTGLAPALHCFRLTATNTYGSESGVSGVAQRNVVAPVPNPPTITTATVVRAWTQKNGLGIVAGRVELDVPCGPLKLDTQKVDWHAMPRSKVKLNVAGRLLKPTTVLVAKCA